MKDPEGQTPTIDDNGKSESTPRALEAMKRTTRRDFFKVSAATIGTVSAIASGLSAPPAEAVADVTGSDGTKFKVIDFRNRPPLKPYSGLFKLRLTLLAKRPNILANPATSATPSPAISMVGKPGALDEWWKEVNAAGIDVVVSNGRYAAGDPTMSMDSATLGGLMKKYKGRFIGLAALNLDQPIEKTVSEMEGAIKTYGLRGANFEPGYRTKGGGPTTIDNADFYPLFEAMSALDLPLMVQTGAFAGLENFGPANDMSKFDTVMGKFPKLKIVLAHGGYPSILDALALAVKHPSVYICPDVYMFWPGGQLYQQNLELLPDQFLYGSAFPFANMDLALKQTLKLSVSATTMKKYLYDNAAKLLKL